MRFTDRVAATVLHATATLSVHYGDDLTFAGRALPPPTRRLVETRHGRTPVFEYGGPGLADAPAYVHLHGGAWLMRHPQMDDWWCRYVAAIAGVRVVNVDFKAGPYVTYPYAQEECHDVAAAEAGRTPVVVGGFSSGGGMAAAVCLMARDLGSFTPRLQVLGVPALDLANDGGGTGMISPRLRGLVRRVYFPDVERRSEPYASPLLAPDLSGLPPAIVCTAEKDALRADGEDYVARLREAGVEVVHDLTPNADHYFLSDDPERARSTMELIARMIRRALLG